MTNQMAGFLVFILVGSVTAQAGAVTSGNGPAALASVLPKAYASQMGTTANTFPHARANMRYQQVFDGTDIGRVAVFRKLALRLDERFGGPAQAQTIELYLGSTTSNFSNIGTNFLSNYVTATRVLMFSGTLNLPQHAGGGSVTDFKVVFPFKAPFIWRNVKAQNLLVEFINRSSSSRSHFEDFCLNQSGCTTTRLYAFLANATTATSIFRRQGLIMSLDDRLTAVPGKYTAFGKGCNGSAGVPILGNLGVQVINKSFSVTLSKAKTNSSALLILGARSALNLPGGCVLHSSLLFVSLAVPTGLAGTATLTIPVPNNASLIRAKFANQWIIVDPRGALFAAFALSNGGEGEIGG